MKKEKGDRLYTVMTVLAVLAFRGPTIIFWL